ncbi:MAG: methylmalonyl Co-A mutase-associated GTPase MeaB [Opitutaceae bacterium]|jgi:LAO/AO transport system kinase|nr:methylmalonyl Co-A mutase-associated GTPase MeaB [Opitutaceae bacterium]
MTPEEEKAHHAENSQPSGDRPDWVPENAGASFATWVVEGVRREGAFGPPPAPFAPPRRRRLSVDDYAAGIRARDITVLARAITLIESNAAAHQDLAQQLLARVLPESGRSMRVGITGIPGAGKSTVIEALGCALCGKGHRVAVLAVDPSSTVTGGSILGDKVRMEKLSRQPGAFIRPSPSGGSLGGVARKSREAVLLCEAAGYDIVIVETVGVGQNEVTVRSMVDCFLLLSIAGAGDEVQGIKKGVMELADLIVVNKADGDNRLRAMGARAELERVLHYLKPATEGWTTPALTASARTGEGVTEFWDKVREFFAVCRKSGMLEERRRAQSIAWMHSLIREALQTEFYQNAAVKARVSAVEQAVAAGVKPSLAAAKELLALWR